MSKLSRRLPDNNKNKLAQLVREFVQGLLARITWYHNIMAGSKDNPEREFYRSYRKPPKVQPPVAQIEWRGNLALLDKLEDPNMEVATLMATIKMNFEGPGI
jgi:phosphodiesterase/alkaline phosphatase D-like protein